MRVDPSSRNALVLLASTGLVGPAWTLRTQADQFLDATGLRGAVVAPDVAPAPIITDR